jgi:hypothetical protein
MKELSKCCLAKVKLGGLGDFYDNDTIGTRYYVCTKCKKSCDLHVNGVPMGVSEWREHGIKYGYDQYFKIKWPKIIKN